MEITAAIPFELKAVIKNKSQKSLLLDVVKIMEEQENYNIARRLTEYIMDRDSYIKNHMGKYVVILENGSIAVTEETDVKDSFKNVPGERYGIVMKIGEEVKDSGATGFYANSFPNTGKYTIPIAFMAFDMPQTRRSTTETVVDTGCTTTTFGTHVLRFIKSHGIYSTTLENIYAIGGQTSVQKGTLTIEFCGQTYENMVVQFADIPYAALIGMDLLSRGKLDVDVGERLSFTHH